MSKFHHISSTKRNLCAFITLLLTLVYLSTPAIASSIEKQTIKSLYIPLADHYAALVAYERYRDDMKHADFQIEQMKNWDLLRAYFQSGEIDMAYVMTPLAIDMYQKKPQFRWIGLMHRDGNALAINELLNQRVQLPIHRKDRKPNEKVAIALKKAFLQHKQPTQIGIPHLLSTHTVVLYRYLKENGLHLSLKPNKNSEVLAIAVPPAKSPAFIKGKSNRATPAAFEQSLPWADIVESGGFGHVAWYSKDVMPHPNGHVECIALASNNAINNKFEATKEVMNYIKLAGEDIELARKEGGEKLESIVKIVRKHIPAHTRESIIASLNPDLRVINYQHLNIDKSGLNQIMKFAVEGGIIQKPINIDTFADTRFDIEPDKSIHSGLSK